MIYIAILGLQLLYEEYAIWKKKCNLRKKSESQRSFLAYDLPCKKTILQLPTIAQSVKAVQSTSINFQWQNSCNVFEKSLSLIDKN